MPSLSVSRIIPTLYSSSLIYKFAADDCTAEVRAIFPVDSHTQTLTAIVAGYQSTISLHRSNGGYPIQVSEKDR